MKITKIVTENRQLEDGDLDLIRKRLPENPCLVRCTTHERATCLGCPDKAEYDAAVDVLREKNIFELNQDYQRFLDLDAEISRLKEEMISCQHRLNDCRIWISGRNI